MRQSTPTFEAVYRGESIRGVSTVHQTDLGPVSIHIAQTKHARSRVNRQLAAAILVSNGFLLVITLGLAYFVVGAGLRPLLRLRREIDARSWHILEPVSQHDLPVELQPIAVALNTLLSVIDDATQAQRRFLADASHQLRTPLAGLQGQLDLLSHENLPQAAHDRIVALHHATRRLSHLSSQLLALGHSDAMAVPRSQDGELRPGRCRRKRRLGFSGSRHREAHRSGIRGRSRAGRGMPLDDLGI